MLNGAKSDIWIGYVVRDKYNVADTDACLIVLENKAFEVYDKSCIENYDEPNEIFNALCDAQRNQDFITVTDVVSCPKDAYAYCESWPETVTGSFRTYTYASEGVDALKHSCYTKLGAIRSTKWVQMKTKKAK